MNNVIDTILDNYCYTELVYGRINKKLKINFTNDEIEKLMHDCLTSESIEIEKIGKNYYIKSFEYNIKLTINSYTYRIITVDRI